MDVKKKKGKKKEIHVVNHLCISSVSAYIKYAVLNKTKLGLGTVCSQQ